MNKKPPPGKVRTSEPFRPRGGVEGWAALILVILLVIPGIALYRMGTSMDWWLLAGGASGASLLTYFMFGTDKKRAQQGEWRIPESTLHMCELLGGWPGGFVAQRRFRHKTSKGSYQFTFWLIVFLHQFIAADYLLGWRMMKELARLAGKYAG